MAPKAKPAAAAAASQPPPTLEDLFTTLNRHINSSSFDNAVKLADQILAVAPADEDALRCKVVALIRDDRLDLALSAIRSSRTPPPDFDFLKAYCLYRQNKLNEALESLKTQERTTETMLLEAQILYRLGKMDACLDTYQKLQKSKIDNLEINCVASLVMGGRSSEVQGLLDSLRVKATSSFELAYNTACSLIERKKYTDAEQLLLSGRRIGQEVLMEDNLPDDEIESELAPLAVQLAYVQQLLGRKQDAIEAYIDIIKRDMADESSIAVAVNNLVSLRGPKDVSDSLRKLDRLKDKEAQNFQLASELDLKLPAKEKEAIYANRVLLLLHANKMDQARELVSRLPDMFPESVIPVLLQAAVLLNIIMQEAASFMIRHGKEDDAAKLYEELVKSQGGIEALVGLVTTVARTDVDKAELYEKQLKALPGLKGIDVDSLERTSGVKQVDGPAHVGITESHEEGKNKTKAKKKRKRKPRYPKGFDPANPGPPPDPERWLPRRERSTYRPKRKDKKAAQVRGSQGAVVREKQDAGSSNNSNPKPNQAAASKGSSGASQQTKPSAKSRKKSRN
ncbi:hypothetical protein PIB30_010018 [Stylosanthes scabra]|uniref:Signal recognition particle subunit SRP72 n=1 Tax=Stylosanthes scabra TaxID=79078 RepID=A0ABU6V5N6_9FABA|nr:hypothetical protein [Stylosanthes scabra]